MVGDESLAVTEQTFRWDRVDDGSIIEASTSANLILDQLSLQNEGQYMCTSVTTSPYLTSMPVVANIAAVPVYGT